MSKAFHNRNGDFYERMASKATENIARVFLPELTPPITESSHILDNACGPGVVTQLIKAQHPAARIKACDLAPTMTSIVAAKAAEKQWANVSTAVLDARDLQTLADNTFTHVITNFGLASDVNDMDGPLKAAREMYRVLKTDGVAVVTTWSERNFTSPLSAAARIVRPHEEPFSFGDPEEWRKGWWLMQRLEDAGFGNKVSVKSHVGRMEAESLQVLVGNMLLFKDMFFQGYGEEEIVRLEGILLVEVPKTKGYMSWEGGVGIRMVAWVGLGWK